jgi:hypothetical protein
MTKPTITIDVTRSTMPPSKTGTFLDFGKELLGKFPNVDRAELLAQIAALYLMDFEYGNKREERAACDFLNLLQKEAAKLQNSSHDPN